MDATWMEVTRMEQVEPALRRRLSASTAGSENRSRRLALWPSDRLGSKAELCQVDQCQVDHKQVARSGADLS